MTSKAKRSEAPLIFIVDDDLSVRRSTARLVHTSGMRAEIFASAQELLDSGRVVDGACLILDVRMPNMDGLELQRLLSETKQRIPVIFFSARLPKKRKTERCDLVQWLFCASPSARTRCSA
jgi:FixJ family two-component response regulator